MKSCAKKGGRAKISGQIELQALKLMTLLFPTLSLFLKDVQQRLIF